MQVNPASTTEEAETVTKVEGNKEKPEKEVLVAEKYFTELQQR